MHICHYGTHYGATKAELLEVYCLFLVTNIHLTTNIDSDSDLDSGDSAGTSSSLSDSDNFLSPSDIIFEAITNLYSSRYTEERHSIPKTQDNLCLLLDVYKTEYPDIFHTYVCISPLCFDRLIQAIQDDDIFQNESNNEQMPIEEQVAIALYWFGHYRNGASMKKVALWARVGYGTVDLVIKCFMTAVCHEHFHRSCIHWPDKERKACAKIWVRDRTCDAWSLGWCMVDGTLVPVFMQPGWHGNSFLSCKLSYSLNVQVCYIILSRMTRHLWVTRLSTLPILLSLTMVLECRVVSMTWLYGQKHAFQTNTMIFCLMASGFGATQPIHLPAGVKLHIKGIAAYNLLISASFLIYVHVARPEKDTTENALYNYHICNVWVHSKHCMGFVKGRWLSLHGLWLRVDDAAALKVATLWIISCLTLHTFVIEIEANDDLDTDEFYLESQRIMAEDRERYMRQKAQEKEVMAWNKHDRHQQNDIDLLESRIKWKELKHELFWHLNADTE